MSRRRSQCTALLSENCGAPPHLRTTVRTLSDETSNRNQAYEGINAYSLDENICAAKIFAENKSRKTLAKGGKVCYHIGMFHIVLVEPEIPQNAGNIARTCAATGCTLHLVKPLGFEISDKYLKRAGLDYWQYVDVRLHDSLDELFASLGGAVCHFFTTKAQKCYTDAVYEPGCALVFGKETKGLDEALLVAHREHCVRIPMQEGRRSLNLSNSVAIAVYEAFRQCNFAGLEETGSLHTLKW